MSSIIYKGAIAGLLSLMTVLSASAAGIGDEIRIADPSLAYNDGVMNVSMDISFDGLSVRSTGATVLSPMIVRGVDTLKLPVVGIYGRTSWYAAERNNRMPLGGTEGMALRYEKNLEPVNYRQYVKYEDWMNGAELIVERTDYGCMGCTNGREVSELARYKNVTYHPSFIYKQAVAESVKSRELAGRAYIDFPVNRTEIYPDYRKNPTELAKIIATIDSVRNDADVTVTAITIKGYASPESPWDNNTRLAKGRTATLKNYVQSLYHFPEGFIQTDYEPEDWEGLREFVASSNIAHKDEILALIDDPRYEPDPKEWKLKSTYPEEYRFLLATVYPGLRHSDYRIEYNIRSFSDPAEIREVLRTQPQKLSLNEIYLATQGLEPGSDEYNEIFETAVRLFPTDTTANLNAANSAMQRGDLVGAARYAERAGTSPEATYARGVLAALQGNYDRGIELIEQAMHEGVSDDQAILEHLREAAEYAKH